LIIVSESDRGEDQTARPAAPVSHSAAAWTAVAAFFSNIVAFKVISLIVSGNVRLGLSALVTAGCVAGGMYARERLYEAKSESPR
jgi:hypothetical protein